MPLIALDGAAPSRIEHTALGRLAYKLRQHMCAGSDSVLMKTDVKDKIYAAFAGIDPTSAARTPAMYNTWVQKLATKEYADELVILACALELKVKLVCVPFTPPEHVGDNGQKWSISQYSPPSGGALDALTVYLGNNDVHFMWLQPD